MTVLGGCTMPLDSWEYADPMEVAMRRESTRCDGCIHYEQTKLFGMVMPGCRIRPRYHLNRRCKQYREEPAKLVRVQ